MPSFLEYIAKQYDRKPEDVATDVLTYLLKDPEVFAAFRQFLNRIGYPHLSNAAFVKSRKRGDNGVPDVTIYGDINRIAVIIENKFWAALTKKQPLGYLKLLKPLNGLLLFVVPEHRRLRVWEEVRRRCQEAGRPINATDGSFIGQSEEQFVAVSSWKRMIEALRDGKTKVETLIDQLREMCDVEEHMRIENLDPTFIGSKEIAKSIYNYMLLVDRIVDAASEESIFVREIKQPKDAFGESWSLRRGRIKNLEGWIGFDARLWSIHGASPIWIELAAGGIPEETKKAWREAGGYLDVLGEQQMLIRPICLEPRVDHDSLVDGALDRLRKIAHLLPGSENTD